MANMRKHDYHIRTQLIDLAWLFLAIGALLAFLFFMTPRYASAQTTYQTLFNGNWQQTNVWSPNGSPSNGDTAIIYHQIDFTATTLDITVANLEMRGVWIDIDPANKHLTMTGPDSIWTSGVIEIDYNNSSVTNAGTLEIAPNSEVSSEGFGSIRNTGTVNHTTGGVLTLGPSITFANATGAVYDIHTDATLGYQINLEGTTTFLNQGTLIKSGGAGTSGTVGNGVLDNRGTVTAASGTLVIGNPMLQYEPVTGTLMGGTWVADHAVLDMRGIDRVTPPSGSNRAIEVIGPDATVKLHGQNASITRLSTPGDFTSFYRNDGNLELRDHQLDMSSLLINAGTIDMDHNSLITVQGVMSMDPTSVLHLLLDAPSTTALFDVTGDVAADGLLSFEPLANFGLGTYRLFDYTGSLVNQNLTVDPNVPNQYDYFVDYSVAGQINLVVSQLGGNDDNDNPPDERPTNDVPEPSTMALAALAAVSLIGRRPRRRK